ncbi:AraC family transcriptional regulator [Pullulanibacillus camelliae]|uniref:AraC family transcriptional regulator n=1 Tax=Pullulanibacillus camelliae TaxID=1707096 RepID=A0A8J2VSL8_9BACL|nr:helix-turn-helix domain-containing protein [Pullulanibacillus camelliae]GGE40717.1 AraC family transcriptional regulator [Pullulanibacillus camelliae]
MKVLKRQFNEHTHFPFELAYRNTKGPKSELPDHFHEWCEIVYIYDGNGTFFINNTFYSMQKGDLFIIPGGTIHHTLPDADKPLTSSAIFFDATIITHDFYQDLFSYMYAFEQGKQLNDYKLALDEQEQYAIEAFFCNIQTEITNQAIGFQSACVHWLHMILLAINRLILKQQKEALPAFEKGPKWIHNIIRYIENHLIEQLTLSGLAREACISPEHFSRVFKQMTGMNVTDYITTKRIIKAKELLLNTDDTVALIAEKSGFYSTPHFYRMFKRYVGKTPSHYRKHS